MSDTHMAGPEYPLNTENGPVDNLSITKTQQRMYRVIRAINAVSPRPQVRLPACLLGVLACVAALASAGGAPWTAPAHFDWQQPCSSASPARLPPARPCSSLSLEAMLCTMGWSISPHWA